MQPYPHGTVVIVLDCHDLDQSATFWCEVLGYQRPSPPSGLYLNLTNERGGVELLLQEVSDSKIIKNRLHLDLRTPDLDAEVGRILDLGAVQITTEPLIEHDWIWHVLADPEGNEFCVLQPPESFPWPERPTRPGEA